MTVPTHCLTARSTSGKARELTTPCKVGAPFDAATTAAGSEPPAQDFVALWDTGATNSAINQKVVDALGLKPLTMTKVQYGDGEVMAEVYRVHITLMGSLRIATLHVTKGTFTHQDVIIGMDVIALGDFAVTNQGTGTVFSFRIPSQHTVDFVDHHKKLSAQAKARASGPGGFPGGKHQKGRRHRGR